MATPDAVVVTRPAGQEQAMMRLLADSGWRPLHVPALRIAPLPIRPAEQRLLMDLDQYLAVIFVSANAVALGLEALADYWPQWPRGPRWLAVGEATASALATAGIAAESPPGGHDSEALLALPWLADLREEKVLLMRGRGGRALLGDTLRDRGARVDYIALYERLCDSHANWPESSPAAVLVTSVESWHCLQKKMAGKPLPWIIAGSERIASAVRDSGVATVVAAASPRDEDMLECLNTHLNKQ